jgi:hypothetical protein
MPAEGHAILDGCCDIVVEKHLDGIAFTHHDVHDEALRSGEECIGKVSNVFRADHGGFRFGRTRKEGPRPLYIVLLPADFAAKIG